jgi:hypothetical protein
MELEEGIVAYSTTFAGLSMLTHDGKTHVAPLTAPQDWKAPYQIYQRISRVGELNMGDNCGLVTARIQFNNYAATYLGARAITKQMIAAYENMRRHTIGGAGGVFVDSTEIADQDEDYNDLTKLYMSQIDILFTYQE